MNHSLIAPCCVAHRLGAVSFQDMVVCTAGITLLEYSHIPMHSKVRGISRHSSTSSASETEKQNPLYHLLRGNGSVISVTWIGTGVERAKGTEVGAVSVYSVVDVFMKLVVVRFRWSSFSARGPADGRR